jgi:hypothetical protein
MNDIPAFPRPTSGVDQYAQKGMLLRDYFAAKAMQADMTEGIHADDFDWSAKRAYLMADAMMKARE